eukprot:1113760_1
MSQSLPYASHPFDANGLHKTAFDPSNSSRSLSLSERDLCHFELHTPFVSHCAALTNHQIWLSSIAIHISNEMASVVHTIDCIICTYEEFSSSEPFSYVMILNAVNAGTTIIATTNSFA